MRYRKESNDKTDNSMGLDVVSFSCRKNIFEEDIHNFLLPFVTQSLGL